MAWGYKLSGFNTNIHVHSKLFQLYRGDKLYWLRKPYYPEITIDPPHVCVPDEKTFTLNPVGEK
jgi:hypothetical protein